MICRRLEWFERPAGPHTALWWVEPGTEPTAQEGADRLALLARRGPTADAFDLAHPFPAPGASADGAGSASLAP